MTIEVRDLDKQAAVENVTSAVYAALEKNGDTDFVSRPISRGGRIWLGQFSFDKS